MNTMIEMQTLFTTRPREGDSPETVAAWYRAKARMHEQLGNSKSPDHALESAHAAASHERARIIELNALRTIGSQHQAA